MTDFFVGLRGAAKKLDTSSGDLGGEPRPLRSSTTFESDVCAVVILDLEGVQKSYAGTEDTHLRYCSQRIIGAVVVRLQIILSKRLPDFQSVHSLDNCRDKAGKALIHLESVWVVH